MARTEQLHLLLWKFPSMKHERWHGAFVSIPTESPSATAHTERSDPLPIFFLIGEADLWLRQSNELAIFRICCAHVH